MPRMDEESAIYRPDSFVLMLLYCANLEAIRYESKSLNEVVADKLHRVIVAEYNHRIPTTFACTLAYVYTLFYKKLFRRNMYWDGRMARKLSVVKPQRLTNV